MKKFIYITIIALSSFGLSSCDLDTYPTDAVNPGLVFENAENAEKILNGTWAYLMDTYTTYRNPGWAALFRASDAMAEDVAVQPAKYGFFSHYSFSEMNNSRSTTTRAVWTLGYKTIDNMNHLITRIDNVEGDAALKTRIKAQAYALRGYIYLNLVTFYGEAYTYKPDALAIPIYTEPSTSATQGGKKRSVRDVYARAEEDLLEAYKLIGDYKRDAKHKIDKSVIAGVLARLYLQKADSWDKAQKYAEEAQTGYNWMSKAEYLTGFNDRSNNEWIWGHGQTTEQSNASYNFHYIDVSSNASYYYSFMADPYFEDFFDKNDVRHELFEWDVERYKGGLMYKKYKFRSDGTGDIVMMRKAEMVLIEAEAFAELNQLDKAINKLNELRIARGADLPSLSTLTKTQLIEVILIERRKELFGEGFGLSDIKRRQKSIVRRTQPDEYVPGSTSIKKKGHIILRISEKVPFTPNSPYYTFTIPALESDNNPNL